MTFRLIVGLFLSWFVLSTVQQFYAVFHAPRCSDQATKGCLAPMYQDEEPVDFLLFLTADPKLRWWRAEGVKELMRAPVWNATSVPFGKPLEAVLANISLSADHLRGVRRNQSMLHLHCFMLRAGTDLQQATNSPTGAPDTGPSVDLLSANVLHAQAPITRLYPHTIKRRRSLLGNASSAQSEPPLEDEDGLSDSSSSTGADLALEPQEETPILQKLPILEWSIPVYPHEALMWVGSTLSATAFLQPSLWLAAVRQVCAVGLAPWLVQLLRQQWEERRQAELRRQQEADLERRLRGPSPVVPHLAPLIRISLAADAESYDARYKPPLLYQEMVFQDGSSMPVGQRDVRYPVFSVKADAGAKRNGKLYAPPMAIDLSGLQQRHWRPLSSDVSSPDPAVPIEVEVKGMVHYSVVQTLRQSLEVYIKIGFTERDMEEIKDFFFRYPLHIMIIMQLIGVLQMSLTTLAFKNDVAFFRGRSDYTGLSSRSLATDTLQEIIIFLYLNDFEDISRIVLFQVGVSALIGAWKFVRVARLGLYWRYFLPWVTYGRGSGASDSEEDTEEIDAKGMRYLKMFMYPLSAAWGIYNVYKYTYKSWWSWLVSSMADFAYTFGFINMMPQIFINYRLKSVAHMPWRVLMYKFFNTFIDDVFAFFIMSDYMTKKHRIMTLRDDIVFFIFLYQRWIYRVDPKRADEYGFVYQEPEDRLELVFAMTLEGQEEREAFDDQLRSAYRLAGASEKMFEGLTISVSTADTDNTSVTICGPFGAISELRRMVNEDVLEVRSARPRLKEPEKNDNSKEHTVKHALGALRAVPDACPTVRREAGGSEAPACGGNGTVDGGVSACAGAYDTQCRTR